MIVYFLVMNNKGGINRKNVLVSNRKLLAVSRAADKCLILSGVKALVLQTSGPKFKSLLTLRSIQHVHFLKKVHVLYRT